MCGDTRATDAATGAPQRDVHGGTAQHDVTGWRRDTDDAVHATHPEVELGGRDSHAQTRPVQPFVRSRNVKADDAGNGDARTARRMNDRKNSENRYPSDHPAPHQTHAL